MSLRIRLILCTLLILLLSLGLGAALAVWHAEQSVRTELAASMEVGAQTLRNGIDDLANARDPAAEAHRLLDVFDGNRHVVATLRDASGVVRDASKPLTPDDAVPRWFLWAVDPRLAPVFVALPAASGSGGITLAPFPDNEAGEVWTQYGDSGATLAAFCLLTSVLIMTVVGRGLRPVAALSDALGRIGAGDYGVSLPETGAPEMVRLAEGFNRMALGLATMQQQNRRLHEQLLALQDEERAELARDLHDEIGPYLFSVNVSTSTIGQLVAEGRASEVPSQLGDIREAVGHMQKHVRVLLRRLRPVRALEFGLGQAVADVLAFWQARHDAIAFTATVSPDAEAASEAAREVVYRLVQESLNNAVRHGTPSRVAVVVAAGDDDVSVTVTDDGGGGIAPAGAGFGLTGMRERVLALGGAFAAGPDRGAGGWRVRGVVPCRRLTAPAKSGRVLASEAMA